MTDLVTVDTNALAAKAEWIAERDRLVSASQELIQNVDDDNACDWARHAKKGLDTHLKALAEIRKSVTKPLDDAKKQIIAQERELAAEIVAERDRVKMLASDYATRMEAAAAKAKAEAEAAQRAAVEEAVATGAPIPDAPAPVAVAKPRGSVTVDKFEVVDVAQVPREYLVVDEKAIRAYIKFARTLGRKPSVPGVRFWQEQDVR